MKPIKYTLAALAVIATASFTTSANAQSANPGDVVLGIYDAATTGAVTSSYELDLGAFSTLTAGETFNLGTTVETAFSSDSSANLQFGILATGATGAGGLGSKQVAYTASTTPVYAHLSNNSTASGDIATFDNAFGGTLIPLPNSSQSSTGVTEQAVTVANSTTGSFAAQAAGTLPFGINQATIINGYPSYSTLFNFYTVANSNSQETAVLYGTFEFTQSNGSDILTFDPSTASVPEPSAYALGLCALALFWVLKRRNSVKA